MSDLRAVMRALPCRRRSCLAQPGSWCQSATGNVTPTFHAERHEDAAALTAAEQAAVVAQANADRAARIAALDANLTAGQQAARDATPAV